MNKIAVVTGSRAEYGLLYWTMKAIEASPDLELQLLVTGMHLVPAFGSTYQAIERDGFRIARKIDMNLASDAAPAIAKSMGLGLIGFAQAYQELAPDVLLVLGDRYEVLCAVAAAIPFNIPVAHLAGGEISEGSTDELIRHAVTKMAHIHFPCADAYADNLIRMGESPDMVFRAGHPGLERIKRMQLIDKATLFDELGLDAAKKTILATLHPNTLHTDAQARHECDVFFDTLAGYADLNIVITYPNSDRHSARIVARIQDFAAAPGARVFRSLGDLRYLSLMRLCDLVVGNSSSAIVEAPYFRVPAVDYGDRQKGRLLAANILRAGPDPVALKAAMDTALYDAAFAAGLETMVSLYGEAETSRIVVEVLSHLPDKTRLLAKRLAFAG